MGTQRTRGEPEKLSNRKGIAVTQQEDDKKGLYLLCIIEEEKQFERRGSRTKLK